MTFQLPETHGVVASVQYDAGGYHVLWYADDDGGSGCGGGPLERRWYGSPAECRRRAELSPPQYGWVRPSHAEGPDRTDPGYWRDNF